MVEVAITPPYVVRVVINTTVTELEVNMRVFSIITAILVMAALYMLVFEREKLMNFATGEPIVSVETDMVVPDAEDTAATTEDTVVDEKLVSVVVLKSSANDITSAVLVRGRTEAARHVDLRAETSGQVISEPLRKGTYVERGQMLCQLDPGIRDVSLVEAQARLPEAEARIPEAEARLPEAQARLSEAMARVTEADINLSAAQRLAKSGFASETRVASAKASSVAALATVASAKAGVISADAGVQSAMAGVLSAQAGIAAANKEIERLTITATFSGHLETDSSETGSLLQPGGLCATVIQLDPIKLVGYVAEVDVDRIENGALAGGRLTSGRELRGKVTFISRSADEATRTFRVEVQVPNTDLTIRDGQTVEIVIASEGQSAHLLPQSSLTLDNDGNLGVRTVGEDKIVVFSEVSVVRDSVDGIWVTGLPETVDVIVVGQEYVIQGVKVNVTYKEAAE
ncbi:MAG: efflux RND transporter periplasmic adaptor subunit [Paracoccaceae bacterium]